jgi:hypothetical protein
MGSAPTRERCLGLAYGEGQTTPKAEGFKLTQDDDQAFKILSRSEDQPAAVESTVPRTEQHAGVAELADAQDLKDAELPDHQGSQRYLSNEF